MRIGRYFTKSKMNPVDFCHLVSNVKIQLSLYFPIQLVILIELVWSVCVLQETKSCQTYLVSICGYLLPVFVGFVRKIMD